MNTFGEDEISGADDPTTYRGTVKWYDVWDSRGGKGFITPDEPDALPRGALREEGDVFVYFNEIAIEGFKGLFSGNRVEFELKPGKTQPDRLEAANVIPLSTYDE